MDEMDEFNAEFYQQVLRGRWGYLSLLDNHNRAEVDGLIALGADILASKQKTIKIGGQVLPRGDVASRLYSLDFTHIDYVLECMHKTTKPIYNIVKSLQKSDQFLVLIVPPIQSASLHLRVPDFAHVVQHPEGYRLVFPQ